MTGLGRLNSRIFLALAVTLYLLFSMISISISQIFLTAAFLFWFAFLVQKRQRIVFPSFFWALIAYALLSLISSFFSVNAAISLKDSRELLLFLVVPFGFMGLDERKDLRRAFLAFLVSGCASILYSLYQYFFLAAPGERITGFMGHYMTQAGLLLLFLSMALAMLFFLREKTRLLWGLTLPLGFFALALTLTRSAWIGVVVAAALILVLYKPVSVVILPIVIGLFFIISPKYIQKRVTSIFGLKNTWNVQRLEYLKAGFAIIKDYPLLGTGPDTVDMVFQNPKYMLSVEARRNVHLHNNIIQIGAERGLPALLAWLAFMITACLSLARRLRNKDPAVFSLSAGALAGLLAVAAAGFFEYNFGDSEITTLFLLLITAPFIAERIQKRSLVR